jgi:hypothetical protein
MDQADARVNIQNPSYVWRSSPSDKLLTASYAMSPRPIHLRFVQSDIAETMAAVQEEMAFVAQGEVELPVPREERGVLSVCLSTWGCTLAR